VRKQNRRHHRCHACLPLTHRHSLRSRWFGRPTPAAADEQLLARMGRDASNTFEPPDYRCGPRRPNRSVTAAQGSTSVVILTTDRAAKDRTDPVSRETLTDSERARTEAVVSVTMCGMASGMSRTLLLAAPFRPSFPRAASRTSSVWRPGPGLDGAGDGAAAAWWGYLDDPGPRVDHRRAGDDLWRCPITRR
jgi:hypothetical protein